MKNRSILSRINAKIEKPVKGIVQTNIETGEKFTYASIDEALSDGFSKPNLLGALKKGTKYKGFLWEYAE